MRRLATWMACVGVALGCTWPGVKMATNAPEKVPSVNIAPNDPHLRYTGRVDARDPTKVSFSFPGVTIEAVFEGQALVAKIADHGSSDPEKANRFVTIVDGKRGAEVVTSPDKAEYEVASHLEPGPHRLALYKLTESSVGAVDFLGFRLVGDGAKLGNLSPRLERKMEIIGDSITCGYGNEARIEPPPAGNPNSGFKAENENNYLAYGSLVARELAAELHTVAVSGMGVFRNYSGDTKAQMPEIYRRTLASTPEPAWDFSKFVPDVVVINLGTNDFGQGLPDQVDFTAAYEGMVADVRERYPEAHIACVTGPMVSDSWPPGEERLTKMNTWISGVLEERRKGGNLKVSFLSLTSQSAPFGEDWHPTLATHRRMADELEAHLQKVLGW